MPADSNTKPKPKRRGGRAKGTPNRKYDRQPATLVRCRACGSTERSAYFSTTETAYEGTAPDGKPYTHIVRRRCACATCGQHRVEVAYENRRGKK